MCALMALVRIPDAVSVAGAATSPDGVDLQVRRGGVGWVCASARTLLFVCVCGVCVQNTLHYSARIECPVKCINRTLYVRISCMIYNTRADYERLADAVLKHGVPPAAPPPLE